MHPESDIARDFWVYVKERAQGNLITGDGYVAPSTLAAELERQYYDAKP